MKKSRHPNFEKLMGPYEDAHIDHVCDDEAWDYLATVMADDSLESHHACAVWGAPMCCME